MIFLDRGGARNLPSGSDHRMRSDSSKGSQESAWVPTRRCRCAKKHKRTEAFQSFFSFSSQFFHWKLFYKEVQFKATLIYTLPREKKESLIQWRGHGGLGVIPILHFCQDGARDFLI